MSKIEVNTVDVQCGSTLTLGSSGKTVTLACGATQSGFGRTGTVDWCTTAKTSPLTAVSGKGYFINTTGGSITVTLPASPSAGDIVSLKDYAKTWDSNDVLVGRNGSKIAGTCLNATLNTEAQSITLIYVDGTQGWIDIQDSTASITGTPNYIVASGGAATITCGDYKTHIFTGDADFTVTGGGNACGSNKIDYVVVGGAGAGGASHYNGAGSGGGGAGGFRVSNSYSIPAPTMSPLISPTGVGVSVQTYPITVGGGGAGVSAPTTYVSGTNGSPSTFSSVTSAGGGGGSGGHGGTASAGNGGSGGGGGYNTNPAPTGLGNTPPVSPPQGQNGGSNDPNTCGSYAAAAGGGAGAVGGTAPNCSTGGTGGAGSFIGDPFFGPTAPSYGTPGPVSNTRYFSGGGGGGGGITSPYPGGSVTGGPGGVGGGGIGGGQPSPSRTGVAGTVNTGGGSGGGSTNYSPPAAGASLAGGSGFVALRYKFQN